MLNPGLTNTTGIITVLQSIAGFNIPAYDYVGVTYPTGTSEVYVFKTGGSGGTTVATVTLVYSDTTKASLTSATKT